MKAEKCKVCGGNHFMRTKKPAEKHNNAVGGLPKPNSKKNSVLNSGSVGSIGIGECSETGSYEADRKLVEETLNTFKWSPLEKDNETVKLLVESHNLQIEELIKLTIQKVRAGAKKKILDEIEKWFKCPENHIEQEDKLALLGGGIIIQPTEWREFRKRHGL